MTNKAECPKVPKELVRQWVAEYHGMPEDTRNIDFHIANKAAEWALQGAEPVAWIPVSERLPEDKVIVLAYIKESAPFAAKHYLNQWIAETQHVTLTGDCPCRHGDIVDAFDSVEVTHWQPLPAPPTTQKGE